MCWVFATDIRSVYIFLRSNFHTSYYYFLYESVLKVVVAFSCSVQLLWWLKSLWTISYVNVGFMSKISKSLSRSCRADVVSDMATHLCLYPQYWCPFSRADQFVEHWEGSGSKSLPSFLWVTILTKENHLVHRVAGVWCSKAYVRHAPLRQGTGNINSIQLFQPPTRIVSINRSLNKLQWWQVAA
jgi:hypothetical protein